MKHSQQKYQILLSNLYSRVPPKIPYITYNRDCESSSLAEEYFTEQWHTWEVKQTSRSMRRFITHVCDSYGMKTSQ